MHLEKEEGASIDGGEGGMSEQAIASEEMKPVVRKSQEGAGALRRSQAGGGWGGLGGVWGPGSRNEEGCKSAD